MTQLARQFAEHPEVRYGLTAMCIGIGMGGTVIWENPASASSEPASPALASEGSTAWEEMK
jgi:acetyl-CoA acyltransferase